MGRAVLGRKGGGGGGKSFDQKHAAMDLSHEYADIVCTVPFFWAWGWSGLKHAVFQQRPPSHTVAESVTHVHTWRLHSTATVSSAELCQSCRGLIALLKGIAVINIDRGESVSHLLSMCQDYL